jgi:spore maturation protein SpmA
MSTVPTLADVITNLINGFVTVMNEVAKAIADYAVPIATLLIGGAALYGIYKFGSKAVTRLSRMFSRIF